MRGASHPTRGEWWLCAPPAPPSDSDLGLEARAGRTLPLGFLCLPLTLHPAHEPSALRCFELAPWIVEGSDSGVPVFPLSKGGKGLSFSEPLQTALSGSPLPPWLRSRQFQSTVEGWVCPWGACLLSTVDVTCGRGLVARAGRVLLRVSSLEALPSARTHDPHCPCSAGPRPAHLPPVTVCGGCADDSCSVPRGQWEAAAPGLAAGTTSLQSSCWAPAP